MKAIKVTYSNYYFNSVSVFVLNTYDERKASKKAKDNEGSRRFVLEKTEKTEVTEDFVNNYPEKCL